MRPSERTDNTSEAAGFEAFASLDRPIAIKAWRAASGRWHMHRVYHFVGCPQLRSAVYLFVRRAASGHRNILGVGYTESATASLNLAAIRQRGASLGATEIHVCDVDGDVSACARVAFDLEAALLPRDAQPSARL